MSDQTQFMQKAIEEAYQGMEQGHGGPFGAVIVKDKQIISRGHNCVLKTNDPTAHAEVTAIRNASKALNDFDLSGCEMYVNGLPCPMCLGAIMWSRLEKVYYACVAKDAHEIGFDDANFYDEFLKQPQDRQIPFIHVSEMHEPARACYQAWLEKEDKVPY